MRRFLQDSEGATAVEYGLIAGLVGLGMVGGLVLLGPSLSDTFNGVSKAQEKAVASVGSGSTSGGATLAKEPVKSTGTWSGTTSKYSLSTISRYTKYYR